MPDDNQPPMPRPTAEHLLIQQHVGRWNVQCKFYMDPSQPPMETAATEVIEAIGPLWTVSRFETDMMGMPFVGCATLGYEPHTGKFVGTWMDCMGPVFFHLTGTQKGDTITMHANALSYATGAVAPHRTTERHISKDERVFEMFVTMPDGNELKMMTTHYRRA